MSLSGFGGFTSPSSVNGEELIGAIPVVAGEVDDLPNPRTVQIPIPKPSTLKDKGVSIVGTSRSFNDYAVDHADGHSISGVQRKLMMQLTGKLLKVIDSGFRTPLPDDMYRIITDRIRERGRSLELTLS